VRDLLLTVAVALLLGLVVFGAVAFTLGKATGLDPVSPDAAPCDVPGDGTVTPDDVTAVRFDVVLRGYRMDQVDTVLERLSAALQDRDEELRALRAERRAVRPNGVSSDTEIVPLPDLSDLSDLPDTPVVSEAGRDDRPPA
jgi:DivIVA domain-containing protein